MVDTRVPWLCLVVDVAMVLAQNNCVEYTTNQLVVT